MPKNLLPGEGPCPICHQPLHLGKGQIPEHKLQHHFWGSHKMDVIKSHEMARKIVDKTITDEELDECRQMELPGV